MRMLPPCQQRQVVVLVLASFDEVEALLLLLAIHDETLDHAEHGTNDITSCSYWYRTQGELHRFDACASCELEAKVIATVLASADDPIRGFWLRNVKLCVICFSRTRQLVPAKSADSSICSMQKTWPSPSRGSTSAMRRQRHSKMATANEHDAHASKLVELQAP